MTISVVALLLVLLGSAVQYTQTLSRQSQRSRKSALAVEIADGHLEALFSSWRNIYRNTWTTASTSSGGTDYSILGGNFFFTSMYNPGPAPTPLPYMISAATPAPIPTPAKSLFPTESNYQLTEYRIQGVDPMVNLDSSGAAQKETSWGNESYVALSPSATPPAAYGMNKWQYSYFYLASVDVTVPTTTGDVTAKVRRVFEKKFDNPWTYAAFFVDDLEFQPSSPFSINGPVHTNGNLYIGTSNFTTSGSVAYGGEYVNGFSPNDTAHSGTATAPTFAKSDSTLTLSDMPPAQVSPYLPFGWNLTITPGGSVNDDSYHELIEIPGSGTDKLADIRMYNQAGYRILIAQNNAITITKKDGSSVTGNPYNKIVAAITTDQAIEDKREAKYVRLATLDISQITTEAENGTFSGWNGVLYIADTTTHGTGVSSKIGGTGTSVTTTARGIRLINGYRLPGTVNSVEGLTVVSLNPIYIKGNYNTSTTSTAAVPSNSGTYTDPDASGYTRKFAAVMGDSITVLSGAWSDFNSTLNINGRTASINTTINAALIGGIVPSGGGNYSGGGENFIRLLEDWKNNTFCYYGSLVQLYSSAQATGVWTGAGNTYKAPSTSKYYWDSRFSDNNLTSIQSGPPGNLQIAAYLQQQRWYQVF